MGSFTGSLYNSPTVTTGSATCVTLSTVLLNGSVNGNGTTTTAWFNYGTASGSYVGTTTTISCGTSSGYVSATVGTLTPWTTYYYRVVAQNGAGTSYGSETTFLPRPQISAGIYHTISLKSDGTVWAWGYNNEGQLGDGTTTQRTTPVQVSGLSGVIAIAGGGYHTIALKSDGTVYAWGRNSEGQLGDGTTTQRTTPVQVSGLSGVIAIAGGGITR